MTNHEVDITTYRHDAFICYSRRDADFARKLEKALENYKSPKSLGVPIRYLDIFRDEEDITGVDYYQSIERHLMDSRKLIVICSPNARKSSIDERRGLSYVDDEIRRFAALHSVNGIVPVLLSGLRNNEAKPGQEDEMSFPEALCELMEMPLAISSYVGIDQKEKVDRGRFESAWYTLLSNLYDTSRAEIEEREKKRRATHRRIKATVVATIVSAIGASGIFYWNAEEERRTADSRKLAKQSEDWLDRRIDRALLLSVAAYREKPTVEAKSALLRTLQRNLFIVRFLHDHKAPVSSLSFSPSGDLLASGSLDKTIRLWETESWSPVGHPLAAHHAKVTSVAFSPDGKTLASAGHDKNIFLWDVARRSQDGEPLIGHDHVIESIAFSNRQGCNILASGDWGGELRLWDWRRRAQVGPVLKTERDINGVVVTPDCSLVVSGDLDAKLRFWDVATGQVVGKPWRWHTDEGTAAIAISTDGSLVASGGNGFGTVLLWDVARMRTKQSHEGIADAVRILDGFTYRSLLPVLNLAFSHDNQLLAVARDNTEVNIQIFQRDQQSPSTLIGYADATYSVAFNPNRRILASGTRDGTIIIRNLSDEVFAVASSLGEPLPPSNKTGSSSKVPVYMESLVFSPDGRIIIVGQGNGRLASWRFDTREWQLFGVADTLAETYSRQNLAMSPDGRTLASLGRDDTIKLWEATSRHLIGTLPYPTDRMTGSLAFSPDGKVLAAISENGEITLWNVAQRQIAKTLKPAETGLTGAYNPETLEFLKRMGISDTVPKGSLNTNLVFSHDGKTLVASMGDRSVLVWDFPNQKRRKEVIVAPLSVEHVALSPDGTMLAVCLVNEGDILFWDLSKSKPIGERIKGAHANRLAFSPDGTTLASLSQDGHVVTLWEVLTRERLGDIGKHGAAGSSNDGGEAITFSPDGKRLASATSSGKLVIWDVDIDSWLRRACSITNRNMTCTEWQEWGSGQSYKKACPDLPAPQECGKT